MKTFKTALNIICFWFAVSVFCYGFAKFTQAVIINSTINSTTIGATTPSTGAFTQLGVSTGVTNSGTGIKHFRGTSCTTASSAGAFCQTIITWPGGAFADTSYTAVCNIENTAVLYLANYNNKTTSQITTIIQLSAGNTTGASGTLDCIAFHD
jgi:hypothetical protein